MSYSASSYSSASTYTPPTDSAYSAQEVTGTPGFMALQAGQAPSTFAEVAPALPAAQVITHSPVAAAGTPISYDYSRNLISADVNTTGQYIPDTTRVLQGSGLQAPRGNYTVQPGDTVYSLARKTCVGVNVIQSMNGIGADYGIKIGQSLNLPASVC